MPRLFMSVADEDRYPIHDILRQTPPIPEGCQWAVFLRNHDELTLEMVSDRERERMNAVYAIEPRMRLNAGIRRRLAPLLDNDRNQLQLFTALLLSLPGSPVLYYGDEIAMGDNVYLGDRDGVRTPMQWSPDRNGGFSSAEPVRLYAPVVTDPTYGYQTVNVELQARTPTSLLNWMRRIIAVRTATRAFGRGTLTLLYPTNRHVLAYLREHEGETLLVVANLAHSAQAVQLDLAQFAGRTPFEMLGSSAFPPIATTPYTITLGPYGFFWFSLVGDPALTGGAMRSSALPELPTVVVPRAGLSFDRWARAVIDADVVPLALGASEHGRGARPGARLRRDRRRSAAGLAAAALRVGRSDPRGRGRTRPQRSARGLDRRRRRRRDDGPAGRARDARGDGAERRGAVGVRAGGCADARGRELAAARLEQRRAAVDPQ